MKLNFRCELKELKEEIGVFDVIFSMDINGIDNCLNLLGSERNLLNAQVKRRQIISAREYGDKFWTRQLRHLQKRPTFLQEYFSQSHTWHAPQLNLRYRQDESVHAALSLVYPCQASPGLTARFILLFKEKERWRASQGKPESLKETLMSWYGKHIQPNTIQMNPMVDYQVISGVSHHILKLLSQGMSRAGVAHEMRLTQRGIDYHIKVLKEVLGAKNTPHLIFISSQRGLV